MRDERRTTPRFALNAPIQVRTRGGNAVEALLIDLSTTGCRFQSLNTLSPGTTLYIRMEGLSSIGASVVWSHDMFAGAVFATPLSDVVVDHLVARAGLAAPADPAAFRAVADRCTHLAARPLAHASADALLALAEDCRSQAGKA